MPIINITVRNKVATAEGSPRIVCGNSDYVVKFDFDEEFAAYTEKTLRIVFRRRGKMKHYDVLFNGDSAFLPPVYETDMCAVGVYAGNLISSTVVMIPCDYCAETEHHDPPPDIYDQLVEYLAGLQGGGAPAGITVPQLYGAAADAAGATTIIEEGTA